MPLLADEDLAVAKRYGVTGWIGPLARLTELKDSPGGRYVQRAIFLIDGDGVVRHRSVSRTGSSYESVDGPRARGRLARPDAGRRAAVRRRAGADAPGRSGGGGAAGRPLPRDHRDPALCPPRLEGAGARRATTSSPTTPAGTASPTRRRRGRVMDTRSWSKTSSGWSRREVGEERFVLGGHSMGAHTAVAYALRHPERLAGLVADRPGLHGRDRAVVAALLGRPRRRRWKPAASTASSPTSTANQEIDPRLARLGPALHPRATAAPAPSRRAGAGAARGDALAARSRRWRSWSAWRCRPGRRQQRRRRPRPSLRVGGGLRRAHCRAARLVSESEGRVAARLAGRQALAGPGGLLHKSFIFKLMKADSRRPKRLWIGAGAGFWP